MLLKILWLLDAFVLLILVAGIFVKQAEKGTFVYVALYIILIGASYQLRASNPKVALTLASIPVAIPILIVLFFFIIFNISVVFK